MALSVSRSDALVSQFSFSRNFPISVQIVRMYPEVVINSAVNSGVFVPEWAYGHTLHLILITN